MAYAHAVNLTLQSVNTHSNDSQEEPYQLSIRKVTENMQNLLFSGNIPALPYFFAVNMWTLKILDYNVPC